ncbi:MAG TPA: hypothetical protein VIB47_13835, partial [Dehalococcoidia bacterium]
MPRLPGSLQRRAPAPVAPEGHPPFWSVPLEQLLRQTGSGLDGLGAEEAAARLRGIGAVAPHHRRT